MTTKTIIFQSTFGRRIPSTSPRPCTTRVRLEPFTTTKRNSRMLGPMLLLLVSLSPGLGAAFSRPYQSFVTASHRLRKPITTTSSSSITPRHGRLCPWVAPFAAVTSSSSSSCLSSSTALFSSSKNSNSNSNSKNRDDKKSASQSTKGRKLQILPRNSSASLSPFNSDSALATTTTTLFPQRRNLKPTNPTNNNSMNCVEDNVDDTTNQNDDEEEDDEDDEEDQTDEHDFMIWKVNASDAFGSMLMQMQSNFQPLQPQPLTTGPDSQSSPGTNTSTVTTPPPDPRASEFLLHDDDDNDDDDNNNSDKEDRNKNQNGNTWKTSSTTAMMIDENQREQPPQEEAVVEKIDPLKQQQQQDSSKPTPAKITRKQEEGVVGRDGNNKASKQQPRPKADAKSKQQQHVSPKAKNVVDDYRPLTTMTVEMAKELDEAISKIRDDDDGGALLLPGVMVPSIYEDGSEKLIEEQEQDETTAKSTTTTRTRFEVQDNYYHTNDELRRVALSVASRTESVESWCQTVALQIGGIYPLLVSIQKGAQAQQREWQVGAAVATTATSSTTTMTVDEASLACRVLRDLCALSADLAAVVVDSILRAASTTHQQHRPQEQCVLDDLATLLQKDTKVPLSSLSPSSLSSSKQRRLYVLQLLLAMCVASDHAVQAIRTCPDLKNAIVACSSYATLSSSSALATSSSKSFLLKSTRGLLARLRRPKWLHRRWKVWRRKSNNSAKRKLLMPSSSSSTRMEPKTTITKETTPQPFSTDTRNAPELTGLNGEICKTANQVLAAIGYNQWVPKMPGQRGLRILTMDGGGSRGMAAVTALGCLVEQIEGNPEICDSFDFICGTSTGGIIAFLTGLLRESSAQAMERYNELIQQIFVKSALSKSLMLFTTASYDESPFMSILSNILQDNIMLDSRSDPSVPYVFAVTSKMSSTPTHVALFRNYNYASGELADPFTINPVTARAELNLPLDMEHPDIRNGDYLMTATATDRSSVVRGGSRHPGSFRVLQRYALRASTAAPTFFKPVMMGGEMYCDGGIVASNPTAVAIHEAKTLFPDVPIEMVVSIGTGTFHEQKSSPRIGWDGIIGQIVNSATDAEQVHHILEDLLGDTNENADSDDAPIGVWGRIGRLLGFSPVTPSPSLKTRYYRFNPLIGYPDEYPIDVTEPEKLEQLKKITRDYMKQPRQRAQLEEISNIFMGRQTRRQPEQQQQQQQEASSPKQRHWWPLGRKGHI